MKEIWKECKNYPSYSISNKGRVMRIKGGHGAMVGHIRSPGKNGGGYFEISLWENGNQYMAYPHHLVAEEFIGPRPRGYEINHKDRKITNNVVSNLEYVLPKDNKLKGSDVGTSKLTESQVRSIRKLRSMGYSQQRIANIYGVFQTRISSIVRKEGWKHVS